MLISKVAGLHLSLAVGACNDHAQGITARIVCSSHGLPGTSGHQETPDMSSCVLSYYKDHDGAEVNAREPPVPTEAARMHVKQYPSAKRSPLIQK